MATIITWGRVLLVAILFALFTPMVEASSRATASKNQPGPTARSKSTEPEGAEAVKPSAGSPELGVVIILGAVGVLVFFAWLFTRVGQGGRSDGLTE
jgi:hypothetical protein